MNNIPRILFVFLLLPVMTFGETDGVDVFNSLITTKSLKCSFDAGSVGIWGSKSVKIEESHFGNGGSVHFDSIDLKTNKARFIGNAGSTDVDILFNSGLTFIEQSNSGNLIFTTVFPDYREGSEEFIAVMSRHLKGLVTGVLPSQYHGTCKL